MLYGDGIHDDTRGIQELLDSGAACVALPLPKSCYLISAPLKIHSYQQLKLDSFCKIRLADNSNCLMLENADPTGGNTDIEICGGIWDYNNLGQMKNPFHFPHDDFPDYNGITMFFTNVKRLRLSGLTMKDPVTFAITLNRVEYFTVENISFDFNYGNPWAVNMDGVHLDGLCRFGKISNLKGTCYDDLVALNADEGEPGPITDIEIDGIFSADCHSAVRILGRAYPVERISISNVFGTYYQYCVGLTQYYTESPAKGYFDGIVLKNLFVSKAVRYPVYMKEGMGVFPVIWVESQSTVKNLHISDLYRTEENTAIETIGIEQGAVVENLHVENAACESLLPDKKPLIRNSGKIGRLLLSNLRADGEILLNDGEIAKIVSDNDR
jgi:hypothetical protein